MLPLTPLLSLCLASALRAEPSPATRAYLGELKTFAIQYRELRKRAGAAFAGGQPVLESPSDKELKAWEASLPKAPPERELYAESSRPADPKARVKFDKHQEVANSIQTAEKGLLPESDPASGKLPVRLDGKGTIALLRDVWSMAVCAQQGRAPGEDAEIFLASLRILAPKLSADPKKAADLYGGRVRKGPCEAGSGAGRSKDAELAEAALKTQAVEEMLRRTDLSDARRTKLEGRARDYADALGGLVFIDAEGNSEIVGRSGDKPLTDAERSRLARLPTVQLPGTFKHVSAEPPAPYSLDSSATAQTVPAKIRYGPDELKNVKLKAWDAVVVTQHSEHPDHSGIVVAMPYGDKIVYVRMDGRPGPDFPNPPWGATSKDPIHTFDTLEEAVKYGYANSDAVILPSKRLPNGMSSGEAMLEYRKSGKEEKHLARWCSTYTKDMMKAGGYDAGFGGGITPEWIASDAEDLVAGDLRLAKRATAKFASIP